MNDDPEKIADVSLHQREAMIRLIGKLTDALTDIDDMVDGHIDIDWKGNPNLAMRVQTIARAGLGKQRW